MKSAMAWIIVLVLVAGGAGAGLYYFNHTNREALYRAQLATIKRNFLVDSHQLHQVSPDRYRSEIGPHLSKYFKQVLALAKEYPEFYDVERERAFGAKQVAAGHMTEAQKLARDERIDITEDLYTRMRDGQYRPLHTVSDNGFRFDVYDIGPGKVGSENRVIISFVHWGPFPEGHKPGSGVVSYRGIHGTIKAVQEAGKPVKVPQIESDPQFSAPSLQIAPERWIEEFIPGVEIGYYDLPQFPRQATSIQLSYDFSTRTVGGSEISSSIAFDELTIPEAWKVPEGQKWEAQERFASDEELEAAGATPTQQ